MNTNNCRLIPKMDVLLELPEVLEASAGLPRALVRRALQDALAPIRLKLKDGAELPADLEHRLASHIRRAAQWRLRRVINATGVVLHTNLGRAPLGEKIASHVAEVAAGYSTLEYKLEAGARGSRHELIEEQLCRLTGAEAAMVVNNNAAAVFLMLNTIASGQSVVVSRGELVEIGGAFRVPEIMAASGAALMEIGTTNKTHTSDYENALLQPAVGALLKVHTSNFKIVGFTEEVELRELKQLAQEHGVPLLYDLGSGFLIRPERIGLRSGLYVPDAVEYADVCCFSGDKLLGAGQAGILLGKKELIERMKRNQLARMLRVDKMTLAALEAALRLYEGNECFNAIPVLHMLSLSAETLKLRAERLAQKLHAICPCCEFAAVPCEDEPGGGSLPDLELPGWAVAMKCEGHSSDALEHMLRALPLPVIGRIAKELLLLSLRTISEADEEALLEEMKAFEAQKL